MMYVVTGVPRVEGCRVLSVPLSSSSQPWHTHTHDCGLPSTAEGLTTDSST